MSITETHFAAAMVIGVMAATMTPAQRREAAERVRNLPGDDRIRALYRRMADDIDAMADEKTS